MDRRSSCLRLSFGHHACLIVLAQSTLGQASQVNIREAAVCEQVFDFDGAHFGELGGFYVEDGISFACKLCPAGRYQSSPGSCEGICSEGYFCPRGSTADKVEDCGGNEFYCPAGTQMPLEVASGYYSLGMDASHRHNKTLCPPGSYCIHGVKRSCPAGRFGVTEGLSTYECTNKCLPGSYCPVGSVEPTICPEGSFCPDGVRYWPCPSGRYGATQGLKGQVCSGLCEVGHFCEPGSTSSTQAQCPRGRYGATLGLTSSACSGECFPGYYCPFASTSPMEKECGGRNVFCPRGSLEPTLADPGYWTRGGILTDEIIHHDNGSPELPLDGSTNSFQEICDVGHYCINGERRMCPAGTYGGEEGLSDRLCSGLCPLGFFCGAGSSGFADNLCPPGRYGNAVGLATSDCSGPCQRGHYCTAGTSDSGGTPCPAGRYGSKTGLQTSHCSDECYGDVCIPTSCEAGYFCPAGSLTPKQVECGASDRYCPKGSPSPLTVSEGYYSTGSDDENLRTGQKQCEPGYYCINGVRHNCPAGKYGNAFGLSSRDCGGVCDIGFYCPARSTSANEYPCPPGRFGEIGGLPSNTCSGLCAEGYYCPEGSTSNREIPCGGVGFFCPQGSKAPLPVKEGFYSVCDDTVDCQSFVIVNHEYVPPVDVRNKQAPCEKGHYCTGGLSFKCPAGRYGDVPRLSTSECSGLCNRGYYCPEGSSSPSEFPCPAGKYGSTVGLPNSDCSGNCIPGYDCKEASTSKYGQRISVSH